MIEIQKVQKLFTSANNVRTEPESNMPTINELNVRRGEMSCVRTLEEEILALTGSTAGGHRRSKTGDLFFHSDAVSGMLIRYALA